MKAVLKSLHGRVFGLADDDSVVAAKGLRVGDFPRQILVPSPLHVAHFDHFVGQALSSAWGVAKGSDAGAANFSTHVALNGTIRGTTGAGATTTMAVNGVQVSGALNFEADSGNLQFGCRVKLAAVTTVAIFVGLTDQTAALEMPINGAGGGDGFTSTATDAVGFLFDTTMTNAHWWGVGVANDVDAVGQDSGIAPVAAAYDDLFIQVDANGNAGFFLNGKPVGTLMQSAVTKSVPLAPVIAAFRRSAASTTIDADYLGAGGNVV
ncbi:MAG TPA: hypothetical protein VFX20_18175 [Steroidobacteraceae bacterium]|nr:hypothetical protein [Steroidobacteraceae bacterium]